LILQWGLLEGGCDSQKCLFVLVRPGHDYSVLAICALGDGKRVAHRAAFAPTVCHPHQRFFGLDVLVSSIVLLVFMRVEGRSLRIKTRWLAIAGLCVVGMTLALPLFLYLRERALEETSGTTYRGAAPA
jgi:heme/copper-type cytochrome/quinol oxidase subunit 4